MSDHSEHPVDFLPELALGVLSPAEAERVQAYLEECDECAEEFALISAAVELLPVAAEQSEPSPGVRETVLERIAADPSQGAAPDERTEPIPLQAARWRKPRWQTWTLGVAAASILALVAGFAGFALSQGTEGPSRETAVVEAAGRGDLEETRVSDGTMQMSLVRAPGESEGFVWMENLPALEEGKAYQAWFTEDFEEFEPSNVFGGEDGGHWVEAEGAIDTYLAMAITVEDEGGADEPSAAPIVVLELQKSAKTSEVPPFMRAAIAP